MAGVCDLPLIDDACQAGNAVQTAVSFGQDPLGYFAQKLQSTADSMATSVLPGLEKATHPDLTKEWFIGAYRISFALAILVWVVFLGWNFVQLARRRISSDALVESLAFYTPTFFFGAIFGPALGQVVVRFTGALTDSLIQWGVSTSVKETTSTLLAAIDAGSSDKIAGGSVVAIIAFGGLILALCTVFLVLLVMLVTLYLAGAVFPLSAVWLTHPRQRSRGMRIGMVWIGLSGAHILIFLMLGIAFRMIGGLGSSFDDSGLQILANILVAVIALILAVMTPFGLLAFAPVGASSATVDDPFSSPPGGGYVGGGYAESDADSQAAQMARADGGEDDYDDDYDGYDGYGGQPALAGVGAAAAGGMAGGPGAAASAAAMEAADSSLSSSGSSGSTSSDDPAGGGTGGSGLAGSAAGVGGGAGGAAAGVAAAAQSDGDGGGSAAMVGDDSDQGEASPGSGWPARPRWVPCRRRPRWRRPPVRPRWIRWSTPMRTEDPMQTRTLGGEGGRRGFFGGSHSRTRIIGLIVVAVVGALATISFQAPGLLLSVAAAGVVFLATIRTHRGSLLTRVQARRRWRERVRLGTVDFAPVALRPADLGHDDEPDRPDRPGGRGGRRARAAARREWNTWRDWPDGAEGMYWLQRGRGEPGIAWHAPTGEDAYLSVAFSVDGQIRGIEGDVFMESAMIAWGNLLSRYGSPSQLPSRVQSLTRVVPVDSAYHEAWVVDHLAADALDELTASYAEVVQRVSRSGLMQRHFVVVRWPITGTFLAAAARRGPAQEGWRQLMGAEIRAVTSHLRTAKLGRVVPLSAAQLAAVLRHMQTPSWPIDQAGDVDVDAPWVASHDELSATITTGPGPDGREDTWWHRTALIPIEAVETGPRTTMWLTPLLSRMPHPIVRTLSLQTEVIPARDARQAARTDVTTDLADLEAQREKGVLTSEELAVALKAARSRLDDLRPGSGHHGAGWAGHVTISARSREALIDATAKITEAAANAGVSGLDWLDTQQSAAAACTWPIARGMRPIQAAASTRLRGVLAGTGSKESI
jgi:hypothetical protein